MFSLSIDDDDLSDSDDESDVQASRGGELFDETASSGLESDTGGESEADSAVNGDVGDAKRVRRKSDDGSHSDLFASSASSGAGLSDSEGERRGKANGETENGKQPAVSKTSLQERSVLQGICQCFVIILDTHERTPY